jgi:hypothetical protein
MRADAYLCASLDEVQCICDRASVLPAGRVIVGAKVQELTHTMDFQQQFRGKGDALAPRWRSRRKTSDCSVRRGRAVLGVRAPDRVRVRPHSPRAVLASRANAH